MKNSVHPTKSFGKTFATILLTALFISSCAELDQLTKPGVEGLQQSAGFDGASLKEGGIGEVHVETSLSSENINSLETLLIAALREKRPDVTVSQTGKYQITANIIADDVTKRADNFDDHYYRWTKRRVKVSYAVVDSIAKQQVWSGIIETSDEALSSYEVSTDEKTTDKVIDAVVAIVSEKEVYPYPSPPIFTDVVKSNFQGFALNLPIEK